MNNTLQDKFQDTDFQSNAYRVYTTLDLRLQRVAADAIANGMKKVDDIVKRQRRFKGQTPPEPQVALVAIDPHTGQVKAVAGGRNYGASQLNHVLSKRQPGSIFKPFVYAAAMDTAVEGGPHVLTPSSEVMDEPTTFWFEGNSYSPKNFKDEISNKPVSLRYALAHSLNIPTVKVAEMVGYDAVVEMANRGRHELQDPADPRGGAGLLRDHAPGSRRRVHHVLQRGRYVKPDFLKLVRDQSGKELYQHEPQEKQVLDPRVAYIMTNLMEEVLARGTAAGARAASGFNVPGGGQDRHLARRLVRRLHFGAAVRGVGGVRRQPRPGYRRRALGRAHLDASS